MNEKKSDSTNLKAEYKPPHRSLKAEFWVGIFFVMGLLCLSYLAFNLASIKLTNAGYYTIDAEFDNVSGLNVGAAVEIAGVRIGDVDSISLSSTSALVKLKILESVPVRDDDIASIRTKGIIGDRYVKIIPGGSDEILKNGDYLSDTESVLDLEEVIGKFIHSTK